MIPIPQISRAQVKDCLEETFLSLQERTVTEIALTSLGLVAVAAIAVFSTTSIGIGLVTVSLIAIQFSRDDSVFLEFLGSVNLFLGSVLIKAAIFTATIAITTLNPLAGLVALAYFSFAGGYAFPLAKGTLLPILMPFLETKEKKEKIITSLVNKVIYEESTDRIAICQWEIATKRTLSTLTTKMIQSLMQKAPHVYTEDFVRLHLSPSRFSKLQNLPPLADDVEEQPQVVTIHPYQKIFHHAIFLLGFSLWVAANPIPTITGIALMVLLSQDTTFRQWQQSQQNALPPEALAFWTQIQPIDGTLQKIFLRTILTGGASGGIGFILLGPIGAGIATSYFITPVITNYIKPYLPTYNVIAPVYSFMETPIGSHFT